MSAENAVEVETSPPLTMRELEEMLGENFVVESFTSRRLTQPGDNYGSNMQALEVKLLPQHSTLYLVAKLPPVSQFLKAQSNFGRSVRKEIRIYTEVAKIFRDIQLENNIPVRQIAEFFPKCYGSHVEYVDDKPVADKSALLLENLGPVGYRCGNRIAGLDLAHTKLAVSRLARFHATAVAVKIKKPLLFRNAIMPACEQMKFEGPPPGGDGKITDIILKHFEGIREFSEFMDVLKSNFALEKHFDEPREPFASIYHSDFWTNNIMFKYNWENADDPPSDVRFVDFQLCRYASAVKDLLFFIYTSTELGIAVEHYDQLIMLYHENFEDQLKKLGCNTMPFSFDMFQKEIEQEAPGEFLHIILMLNIIMKDKTMAMDINEVKGEDDVIRMLDMSISDTWVERALQVIKEYVNKGWLS